MTTSRDDLASFVRDALTTGASKAETEAALTSAGWQTSEVRSALSTYADQDFPIPVPRPRPYVSPRETFLYLGLFTALYVSAYNLGGLAFLFIEKYFPDPTSPLHRFDENLSWAIAWLAIAFPIYLYLVKVVAKGYEADPTRRISNVRRWLTYLTLFVAGCVVAGDVVTLLQNLLRGDLSVRFVLKVTTVAVIAGAAFAYYFTTLRGDEKEAETDV